MYWASFNRFEFQMSEDSVNDCSHQGACDNDVAYWSKKINLDHVNNDDLKAELKECGAWSNEELEDRQANIERIIWIGANNIKEELAQ